MRLDSRFSILAAGSLLLGACSMTGPSGTSKSRSDWDCDPAVDPDCPNPDDGVNGDDTWRPIGPDEDPSRLVRGASRQLSANIVPEDVGKTFGVPRGKEPYPDTYWPFTQGGVDAEWNEAGVTPLRKFMKLFGQDPTDAIAWEDQNHGRSVPGVQDWFGHCPGWTGAALLFPPIKNHGQVAVSAQLGGDGSVVECQGGDNCVDFLIGDINALEAEVYNADDSIFMGERCDTPKSQIRFDASGRVLDPGCRGFNAGSLLIVTSQLMKRRHTGFALDAQTDFNTDQIWNQPAYAYQIKRFDAISEAQAANLVANCREGGNCSDQGPVTRYGDVVPESANTARGFALVQFDILWVSERGPNTEVVSGRASTRRMPILAVIELSDAADLNAGRVAQITGGEYLQDDNLGSTRLTVPPFVWLPRDNIDGQFNPGLNVQGVKDLIGLGTR
jgi:hypothetical protein